MKRKLDVLLLALLALFAIDSLQAQDNILFLNGKSEEGKFLEIDSISVRFERLKKGKKKIMDYQKHKVFSVQMGNGDKTFVYAPDSLETEILTIEEMELFVLGQQEARKGFKAPLAFFEGFFCGVVCGYFGNAYMFYTPVPLVANSLLIGKFKTKVNIEQVLNPNYFKRETYLAGYAEQAGFRKMQSVTIGSILGLTTGFALSLAIPSP
jgi:hypothetical protein